MWTTEIASPMGPLRADADADGAITRVSFGGASTGREDAAAFVELTRWFEGYFAKDPPAWTGALAPGGTNFQRRVWDALQAISFGRTQSYGALAERLGGATLTRAVGRANGANPIAVLVPCHRVIGADGDLTGYAGGLANKRWLLRHEGVLLL